MSLVPIASAPGVQRDGTLFDGKAYASADWCRFYRGKPKKIAGFRELTRQITDIGRGIYMSAKDQYAYVHIGTSDTLERINITLSSGVPTGVADRTPAGFVADPNNLWQFDSDFDAGTSNNIILAHAAPNMASIANEVTGPVYFGDLTTTAALTAVASSDVSGGIVVLHPYLFVFGSNGYLGWSVADNPTDLTGAGSGAVRPTANKIVRGLPLRAGPGTAPAGLFWSLNTLSRVMFTGGSSVFSYDTITTASSILSAMGVIEHNGIYYWPTVSGFVYFNGVMRDIPNTYNHDWFYKNLNQDQKQKVFATKVPKWKEIWWCFPTLTSTECNHAIVFNYESGFWFDTPLPGNGRSCGFYEQIYPYPLMVDAGFNDEDRVSLWQHEFGVDEVSGRTPVTLAVPSRFRTTNISVLMPTANGPGQDKALSAQLIEPDFAQVGDMVVRIFGAPNAACKTPQQIGDDVPMVEPATGAQSEQPGFTVTERLLQFEFESNVVGGDYEMGSPLLHIEEGDDRRTS